MRTKLRQEKQQQLQQPEPKRHFRPDSDNLTDEVYDTRSNAAASSYGGTFSTNSGTRTGTFSESGIYLSSSPFNASSEQLKHERYYREKLRNKLGYNITRREQPRGPTGEFVKTAYIGNIPYLADMNEVCSSIYAYIASAINSRSLWLFLH